MKIKQIIQALLLGLVCYFVEFNFLAGWFHSWVNVFLIISLLLIFRQSPLWWPWLAWSLVFVWLGVGGWWWLSFVLISLFAWWLRQFFSGSSRFWQLSIFGLISLSGFFGLLLLPNLLVTMVPKFNWSQVAWAADWWLYFLAHLILLFIGYLLTGFSHER